MMHLPLGEAKRRMAELYSQVAPVYAEGGPPRFAYAGRRLVEVAGVGPGDAVLDLGTGRGAVLLVAADRVGPTGRAIGIDLARGMVERTTATIVERRLHWASVQVMDSEDLDFAEHSFTHVLGSYVVFFFADLSKVLDGIRRVLRPNGVVGFAFERGADPRWAWYEGMLQSMGAFDRIAPPPGIPGIRAEGALVERLKSAGFDEAREHVEEVELFYRDADAWWESLWTHGSRRALEVLTPAELARLRAMSRERARDMATAGGLPERHHFVFVIGRCE